ncbi:unnamed protein product [Dicrocoelium dendriticum]|nr:unnamed protein product [Dicrocoelium dendriticum]
MRTAGNTGSNVVMDSASLITSNPTFSADLVNALCPPNNVSAVRTHLTAAILPYLAKLSSTVQTPIAGKSMTSPSTTSTEFPVIPLPLGTRLLDSSPKLRINDSNRILQDAQNTAKQPSETYVPPPRAMPLYCDGCKQYFASDILYTCHLKMSSHLVNFTESHHLKTNGKVRWSLDDNIHTGCPFALSSAVSQLGLVLAAPLFTVDGVQYVPVNPKCGLLLSNHMQNDDHVSPDQWVSASGQDTHEEDVTQRSMSAATVTTVTTSITPSSVSSHNVLSALDLSCPLISSDSSVTMLPIQRLFDERVAVNNCQAVIEQSTDSSNKYMSPTGTNDSVATNAANKQNLGHISPEMLQLVATLLSSMVIPTGTNRSPPKYVPQAKTDHPMTPEPSISTVPFNLPQFIAQLYLNSIPCNSQNLMNLPGSFDSGANSAISSSTNDMSSAVDSVQPSAPYHQPQLLPAQSSLAHASALTELVPAITVFNSVYQGELCDALGYMESNAHTTSALLPKNFAPSGVECSISPAQSPQPESTPHRPYLCTYCQTRFLAYSTFQAHQQSYCQARRDAIRNPITAPTSSASTMAMTANAVAVSANQPSGLGNSSGPAKRRRTQPISPHALIETQPSTKASDSRLSFSSSNVSSASGSGDEGDMRRAKEVIASNKTETLKPTSKMPSENANAENINLATVWEQCGSVELRCAACGYVGQTSRGMKMHKRLHECKGVATREAKQSGKKRDRESTNDDSVHFRVDRSREKHSERGFLMRVPEEPVKSESV